jgi:predicted DsbA family dithiol-disulfide isomerase
MRFDRAVTANTLSAHRLLRLAKEEYGAAAQHELVEELFAAHFVYGGDVGDRGLLIELAVDAGLDRTRVATYLASDEGLEPVRAAIREALNLGISAVPTFIFDKKYAIEGGQPAPVFLQALGTATRELGVSHARSVAGSSTQAKAVDRSDDFFAA